MNEEWVIVPMEQVTTVPKKGGKRRQVGGNQDRKPIFVPRRKSNTVVAGCAWGYKPKRDKGMRLAASMRLRKVFGELRYVQTSSMKPATFDPTVYA